MPTTITLQFASPEERELYWRTQPIEAINLEQERLIEIYIIKKEVALKEAKKREVSLAAQKRLDEERAEALRIAAHGPCEWEEENELTIRCRKCKKLAMKPPNWRKK